MRNILGTRRGLTAVVAVVAATLLGTVAGVTVNGATGAAQTVQAKTDINSYISSHKIKPKTSITKELHTFSMFDYSTANKLPNGIVFHWTANGWDSKKNAPTSSANDTARSEANYEINSNHWKDAFVHTFIDHSQTLNIHDTSYGVWGSGPYGNARFIQFELCTEKTTANFAQSISNAAYYAAFLCQQYGLKPSLYSSGNPHGTIWTHHQVSTVLGGTDHVDPDAYLKYWGYSTSQFLTLVKQYYNQLTANSSVGRQFTYSHYVSIKSPNYTLWGSLDFKSKKGTTKAYNGKTLQAKYGYANKSGAVYLSLYDQHNKWVGYLNISATKVTTAQGPYISYGKYVSITKKGYTYWHGFDWSKMGTTTTASYQQTFLAKGKYQHANGSTYLSLYKGNGKWAGYVNADATKVVSGPAGPWFKANTYLTATSKNYTLWNDLNFTKKRGSSASFYQGVAHATGVYHHFNGSTYYSLYDHNNKWLGYINATGVKTTSQQGPGQATSGQYLTLTRSGYNLWNGFSFTSAKAVSAALLQRTYQVKRVYHHFNGTTYDSLYDAKGQWFGYVNSTAGTTANNAGGAALTWNKAVKIQRKGYTLWNNFKLAKRGSSTSYYGQTLTARVRYNHQNNSTYYSLYQSNGKWAGYLNATATTAPSTIKAASVPSNLYGVNTNGLTSKQKTFLKQLISYALPVAKKYGLYPSILVMQVITESGWGTSTLAQNANAFCGIKADTSWSGDVYVTPTTEVVNGQTIKTMAAFRKYASMADGIEGYATKVTTSGLYPGLLRKNSNTWQKAVQALKIYATSPTYVSSLTTNINHYQLNKLDTH